MKARSLRGACGASRLATRAPYRTGAAQRPLRGGRDKGAAHTGECAHCDGRMPHASANLLAAPNAVEAPGTEVFAVVGQQAVAVFTETRTGALHSFAADVAGIRFIQYGNRMGAGEASERDLLDRAATQRRTKARIVDDPPVSGIDSVVAVAGAMRDEVSAEGKLDFVCIEVGVHGIHPSDYVRQTRLSYRFASCPMLRTVYASFRAPRHHKA